LVEQLVDKKEIFEVEVLAAWLDFLLVDPKVVS
jgi:hypothetical protein